MDLRDGLRISFAILSLCSYATVFIGYKGMKKAVRGLDKHAITEITKNILLKWNRLMLFGVILGSIFGLIAILLLHRVI